MPIPMQGSWTVSVKSKNASFAQRFVIQGAASGNGTYLVGATTAPVSVSGAAWTVSIQHDPGTGFRASTERIKTPTTSGGFYRVDIESNDSGGDQDFDDLILTCSMPVTTSDFLVYGHVTSYSGLCFFNPCLLQDLVIESYASLLLAWQNPVIREELILRYPRRVLPWPPPPPPDPLREAFSPMVLPLRGALPAPQALIARKTDAGMEVRTVSKARASAQAVSNNALALAQVLDASLLIPKCTTSTLAGYVLSFQEYDRTASELAGGSYTGTGGREELGVTVTDAFGNYIFRFSRGFADVVQEVLDDVAVSEDAVVQSAPDLIIRVLDTSYETSPRFNLGFLTRVNLCVPGSKIAHPNNCAEAGFTEVGSVPTNRVDSSGRVTSSAFGSYPGISCGVWYGTLDLWACLGESVKYYTLAYKPQGATSWEFYSGTERRRHTTNLDTGITIGPFYTPDSGPGFNQPFDGPSTHVPTPAYRNIKGDNNYVSSRWDLKASFPTSALADGPCDLRLDGYDAAGNRILSESYTLRLYLDNSAVEAAISRMELAGEPIALGPRACTLVSLDDTELLSALQVDFRVIETHGALGSYGVSVYRCNEDAPFPVTADVGGGAASGAYAHVPGACATNLVHGTPDDLSAQPDGTVTVRLVPANPWLSDPQRFTILRVYLSYQVRATNGYGVKGGVTAVEKVFGVQKV